ncbi:hypothetical protein VV11_012220 [Trichodesmium erythraeum 21-75]|nr:hypothetical protein [Trichodesmium erythraeum 21-75]
MLKKKKLGDLNLKAAVKDAEAIANILEKYGKFRIQRLPSLPKNYDQEGTERFDPKGKVKINELQEAIINLFKPRLKMKFLMWLYCFLPDMVMWMKREIFEKVFWLLVRLTFRKMFMVFL